jgi:hypothetical protein
MSNKKRSKIDGKCLLYLLCVAIVFRTKWLEGYTSWIKWLSHVVPDKQVSDIKKSTNKKESQKV